MISAPSAGWAWIRRQPSESSGPRFPSTRSGTPILPRSCSAAAKARSRRSSSRTPSARPTAVQSEVSRSECSAVARWRSASARPRQATMPDSASRWADRSRSFASASRAWSATPRSSASSAASGAASRSTTSRAWLPSRSPIGTMPASGPRTSAGASSRRSTRSRRDAIRSAGRAPDGTRVPSGGRLRAAKPWAEARMNPSPFERQADTPSCGTRRATASVSRCSTRSSPCSSDSAWPSSTSALPVRAAVRSSVTRPACAAATSAVSHAVARNNDLVFGGRIAARAHNDPPRRPRSRIAEPAGEVLAAAHRGDARRDGRLDRRRAAPTCGCGRPGARAPARRRAAGARAAPRRARLQSRADRRPPQARSETRP